MTNKKLLIINGGLLIINIIIATILFFMDNSGAQQLNGTYVEPKSDELISTVLLGLIISIPILCLLLGLITSIFIDKDIPYGKRYVKGFLLTLGTVYILYSVMGLIKIITLF